MTQLPAKIREVVWSVLVLAVFLGLPAVLIYFQVPAPWAAGLLLLAVVVPLTILTMKAYFAGKSPQLFEKQDLFLFSVAFGWLGMMLPVFIQLIIRTQSTLHYSDGIEIMAFGMMTISLIVRMLLEFHRRPWFVTALFLPPILTVFAASLPLFPYILGGIGGLIAIKFAPPADPPTAITPRHQMRAFAWIAAGVNVAWCIWTPFCDSMVHFPRVAAVQSTLFIICGILFAYYGWQLHRSMDAAPAV